MSKIVTQTFAVPTLRLFSLWPKYFYFIKKNICLYHVEIENDLWLFSQVSQQQSGPHLPITLSMFWNNPEQKKLTPLELCDY